jgi:hypothetical protein
MASTYLTRTPSSATNRKTFTLSGWFKRGSVTDSGILFEARIDNNNRFDVRFDGVKLMAYANISSSEVLYLVTSAVLRDPSAWYHVVVTVDTTQSTQSDRAKIYLNGSQVTSFSTNTNSLTSSQDTPVNTNNVHSIGANTTGGGAYDGYMSHVHFIDGTAYAASTFGSTATNGQWVPNETPSVTYGTNGYFLKFTNASDLGEDFSGNNNDFTKNGNGDKTNDNPKNVFATLNPLYKQGSPTFSEGNTKVVLPAGDGTQGAAANFAPSAGKWYWEIKQGSSTNSSIMVREASDKEDDISYYQGSYAGYELADGDQNITGNTTSDYGATYTSGDIIMVALDMDNNRVYFGKNGLWNDGDGNADESNLSDYVPLNGVTNGVPAVANANGSATATFQFNFGNPAFTISSGNADGNGKGTFEYAPPTNYLALCTDNLSSALTQPIGKGGSYMNTVLYTGNGSNGHAITGVGFQPDWVWLKSRVNAESHWLGDSNRGGSLRLQADSTNAEFDTGPGGNNYPGVSAFDSDGFTVGRSDAANANNQSMVAWNWRAGGSSASNSDGSITSSVTVNTTAGFSVVTHTGTGSGSTTVGHGLGKVPAMIIVKDRGQVRSWNVYHQSIGNNSGVNLNGTGAQSGADSGWWNNTTPTSSVFTLGTYANESSNYVSYCFAEIEGYSKFDKYTGNASTDGPFVYTGFKPAWVMIKRMDGGNGWTIYDSVRNPSNVVEKQLMADANTAEEADAAHNAARDFLSNGFKIRETGNDVNVSGSNYLYMAFAENPFVDSSGIPTTAR